MGSINGTEVARQASSIILTKGDFTSIVNCIMWGRTVNTSVKKFLQFQISITITVAFIAFVSALSNPNGDSVLTSVQLMWVNLFQDTGALALATDRPQTRDLKRRPESLGSLLITTTMWKTIIGLSVYQIAVTYVLYFVGPRIFPSSTDHDVLQLSTLVFNGYVWMQIFTIYKYVLASPPCFLLGALVRSPFGCLTAAGSATIPSMSLRACSATNRSWPSASQ
jgi:Ca2+-transporting ATPase